jgi:tRNA threonylcarbamoyladenosine biosynthesis protein TsaB
MTKILAIETATKVCSIAVLVEDELLEARVLGETWLNVPQVHAERIAIMISNLLNDLHLKYKDLDAVSVSIGPGSFTGLRIGLSVAKGIAYALDKKLIAVPTLDAIAYKLRGLDGGRVIIPVIHARGEEFYYASFKFENRDLTMLKGYHVAKANDIAVEFAGEQNVLFVGEEVKKFSDSGSVKKLERELTEKLFTIEIYPSASSVAYLAAEKFKKREFSDVRSIVPLYIKDFLAVKGKPASLHGKQTETSLN